MKPSVLAALAALTAVLGSAVPARAELVFFASGRSLSIKAHTLDGESLVLMLRAGGEIVCDRTAVVSIEPDEVPYPEPALATAEQLAAQPIDFTVRYADIIDTVSAAQGVPPQLVRAVIKVESNFQERARSRKGAMGLMQLMPDTARQFAVADPYDPRANIEGGVKYLKSLLQRFSLTLALAAYNAGEATVQKFGGIPPYPETREYVSRIVKLFGRSRL